MILPPQHQNHPPRRRGQPNRSRDEENVAAIQRWRPMSMHLLSMSEMGCAGLGWLLSRLGLQETPIIRRRRGQSMPPTNWDAV
jgi:hypothetical protein